MRSRQRSARSPRGPSARRFGRSVVSLLCLATGACAAPVAAAVFPVSDAAGLIAAIDAANATPAVDVIRLDGDVTLAAVHNTTNGPNGTPVIETPIVLLGNGFAIERDPGAPSLRLFYVAGGGFLGDGALTLDRVTLRGGDVFDVLPQDCFLNVLACGGAILNLFGELTIRNETRFEGNAAFGGGALFNAGNVTIEDATFEGNRASSGGAIYSTGGVIGDPATILVARSRFESNQALIGGGAIQNQAELEVADSVFRLNEVTTAASFGNGGGALYNTSFNGLARFTATSFVQNRAPRGGALSNYNASDLALENCDVQDNENNQLASFGGGGGIWSDNNTDLAVRNSRIVENRTLPGILASGGGIYSGQNNELILEGSVVSHNVAGRDGGGIYMDSVNATVASSIANSRIDFNEATGDGGGIYKDGSSQVTIVASSISDNLNHGFDGGGLAIECVSCLEPPAEGVTIVASTIARNVMTTGDGGGVFNENQGVVTILDSTISDNSVTGVGGVSGLGGGIYSNSTNSRVTVVNTTISGNYAQSNGGGTYNSNASTMTLQHVTVAGNTADLQGGGIFAVATTNVQGSVIADNAANHPVNPQQHDCGGFPAAVTSFVDQGGNLVSTANGGACPAGFAVSTEIDLGPLADNGGPSQTHALLEKSSAIDAAGACALATDQRGVPRETLCDSGAFENDAVLPVVRFSANASTVAEAPGGRHEVSVILDNRGGTLGSGSAEVHFAITGTAAGGEDFDLATLPPLVFSGATWPAPGSATVLPVALDVLRDFQLEGDETIRLELRDEGIVGAADLGTRPVHTVTVLDALSDLAVEKSFAISDDGETIGAADPGDEITYTVTVSNLGPTGAEDVTVEDVLDPDVLDLGSVAAAATRGSFDPATGEWSLTGAGAGEGFDLAAGESETLTIAVRVRAAATGGILDNTAHLSTAFPPRAADPDAANDSAAASLAVFACPPTPASGCVDGFEKATLVVNEQRAGRESLAATLRKGPALGQGPFGDPLDTSGTGYLFCLYDDRPELVVSLALRRAGDACPTAPCWKPLGGAPPDGKGFRYRDRTVSSDGVRILKLEGGDAGKSVVLLRAKNSAGALPAGIAAALEASAGGATAQILSSDASCFSALLSDVKKRSADLFRAKSAP